MYKTIYFAPNGVIMCRSFDTNAEAQAFALTKDWAIVVKYTDSRTIQIQT